MAIVDTESVSIADLWRLLTPTIGVNNLGLKIIIRIFSWPVPVLDRSGNEITGYEGDLGPKVTFKMSWMRVCRRLKISSFQTWRRLTPTALSVRGK